MTRRLGIVTLETLLPFLSLCAFLFASLRALELLCFSCFLLLRRFVCQLFFPHCAFLLASLLGFELSCFLFLRRLVLTSLLLLLEVAVDVLVKLLFDLLKDAGLWLSLLLGLAFGSLLRWDVVKVDDPFSILNAAGAIDSEEIGLTSCNVFSQNCEDCVSVATLDNGFLSWGAFGLLDVSGSWSEVVLFARHFLCC